MVYTPLSRLGIGQLFKDHTDTLYVIPRSDGVKYSSTADAIIFFIFPIFSGLAVVLLNVRMQGIEELIGGVSVFTGLLFGLLVHVFSVGLTVASDPRYRVGDPLPILLSELRANVSYACATGLLLTAILGGAAALGAEGQRGAPSWLTGIVLAVALHMGLTLLMVLKRVRSIYLALAK